MSDRLKKLREQRATAWAEMNALREAIGESPATTEQRSEWDRIEATITALSADADAEERAEKLGKALALPVDERIEALPPVKDDGIDEKRYGDIYNRFMRWGNKKLSGEERTILEARFDQRAQAEGTGGPGGYLVPQGYWVKLTETLKAFGGLMGEANIIRTATGNILPWPSNNDTGNLGALLSENTQVTEVDVAFTTKQLSAWTYTSNLVLASLQLLQDSAFDLDSWLPKKLGQRLGRAIAADLVSGAGTTKPLGIAVGPTTGVTGATGAATTVTYASLVALIHSVDAAYRQLGNCKWLMNDQSVAAVRTMTDTQGRPLWSLNTTASLTAGEPDSLMGYPIIVDNAMPVMAANAKSILFGDFEAGYVVRQVLDPTIMRLAERYADYLQVGFFGFQRIDGTPDDTAAVRAYVNAAT